MTSTISTDRLQGIEDLDEAAVQTLNQIGTLPLPEITHSSITLFVPIRYEIHPVD